MKSSASCIDSIKHLNIVRDPGMLRRLAVDSSAWQECHLISIASCSIASSHTVQIQQVLFTFLKTCVGCVLKAISSAEYRLFLLNCSAHWGGRVDCSVGSPFLPKLTLIPLKLPLSGRSSMLPFMPWEEPHIGLHCNCLELLKAILFLSSLPSAFCILFNFSLVYGFPHFPTIFCISNLICTIFLW